MTSSIGIAVFPVYSDNSEELLKYADVAMYRSKDLGRNTYQFLDANLAEDRLRQHTLETALRTALADNALRLHYQPVVQISDRAIVGAESHGGVRAHAGSSDRGIRSIRARRACA